MSEPTKLLPPMTALRCFSAAARLGSFSRAADELGLTQSAVSRQMARLEKILGAQLFERHGPRIALSEAGRLYAGEIDEALTTIRRAGARVCPAKRDNSVTIATLPSFGMRWLAPRLAGLARHAPDLVVNFSARSDEFDLEAEGVDAAIHFGQPDWPRARHDRLFGERSVPVISPQMTGASGLTEGKDLLNVPLLVQSQRKHAWKEWFTGVGVDQPEPRIAAVFDQFSMLSQAVVGGAGAALLPTYLIAEELRSGALVAAFDLPTESRDAYFLVYPEDRLERPAFRRFRNWLLKEAASEA